ncbi:MAG: hypothetical protein NW220_17860 [Leptolyngbyaceae cyanobacterium bins.349]|nr:hypothetical protein [Leptolyngbyaceae cyanobacterium bins.349]
MLSKDLEAVQTGTSEVISSNTQSELGGIEAVKQRVAEIQALQGYKRAAQKDAWEQLQLIQQSPTETSPAYIARMHQWLELDDPILMAEAEAFFKYQNTD